MGLLPLTVLHNRVEVGANSVPKPDISFLALKG